MRQSSHTTEQCAWDGPQRDQIAARRIVFGRAWLPALTLRRKGQPLAASPKSVRQSSSLPSLPKVLAEEDEAHHKGDRTCPRHPPPHHEGQIQPELTRLEHWDRGNLLLMSQNSPEHIHSSPNPPISTRKESNTHTGKMVKCVVAMAPLMALVMPLGVQGG